MMTALKELLFGRESEPRHDPLPALLEAARHAERDAWEAVNESRQRRGEPPLAPSWESLIHPEDAD